ncbi:NAD(P)/FAD-dependent oxidoreductase [Brevibacillus porteri]|uniref:NAD(P)/FAD-dependent oxidoreductase n=1 Tax=Brevibacillus porteri TaxID=2126350 RepID=UPI00363AAA7B
MQNHKYDVVVIGGGVVGTAILRALSFYQLKLLLIEKQPDVCEGTSKANSGIVHTGFDAKPGTVEAECLRRSRSLWPILVENLRIPFIPCGAVMVATNEEEKQIIETTYVPNAKANDVDVHWMSAEEILEMNPAVTAKVTGGLAVPGEAICDPFWATRAFGEIAVLNGAEVVLGQGVSHIETVPDGEDLRLTLENGETLTTRYAVNAAGLWSDEIARMVGDESFSISPRKGQFILTEEAVPISSIILPVPTKTSKGVLVSPVVFGGFLLGPTAEDQEDKWDRSTSQAGMESVLAGCEKLVPDSRQFSTIRQFAGVRAVCSEGDFVIRSSAVQPRMIHAAGIRSTGLSASPGIAELVAETLQKAGLELQANVQAQHALPDLFSEEQETGEIICLCRSITRNEIVNALKRPLTPQTIDGVKRRTGATLGECQGNCCIPKIIDVMAETYPEHTGKQPLKGVRNSYLAVVQGEKQA